MNKVATKPAAKAAAKPAPKPAAKPPKANTFNGLGDILAGGFDVMLTSNETDVMLNLDDIEIVEQVREEFEDETNSLADLGRSLRKQQLQSIVVRPIDNGPKPYRLVAGERRCRGARLEGLKQLRARIVPMTEEEAEDAQLAENIHRKNLTQIEEAKKIQRDLDTLGSVEAVLEKHQKSRPWLSKVLSLLTLPEQAKRLVTESVSADVEVINTVKIIEKKNPEVAKKLVDELKQERGKVNAREKVAAIKDTVKPPKEPKESKASKAPKDAAPSDGITATPKDRTEEEPGPVSRLAKDATPAESVRTAPALPPVEVLRRAYMNIFEKSSDPQMVVQLMSKEDRENCEGWLQTFYDAGVRAPDLGRTVIQGFRSGNFATDGHGAFALAAFLHGADTEAKFNLLNILGCAKA
jgi:ParB family chromosome partitioning protein